MLDEYFKALQEEGQGVNPLFAHLGATLESVSQEEVRLKLEVSKYLLQGAGVVAGVADLVKHKDNLLDLGRMLSLREMFAVQENACLHVGNCSAPRHSAVAVGTPTLTVLGATSRNWPFPSLEHQDMCLGLPCQPCNSHDCPIGIKCLRELDPETVFITLRDMLPPPVASLEA